MRILLVDPSDRGGIASYSALIARSLCEIGEQVVLLGSRTLSTHGGDYRVVPRLPVAEWGRGKSPAPIFYARRAWEWLVGAAALRREVARSRPDVVHVQMPLNRRVDPLLLRALASQAATVWTAHDVLPPERTEADSARFARIYRAVDQVIVHSRQAARELRGLADVEASVIQHPVTPVEAPVARDEAREQLGLPQTERVLGAIGFIRDYKGYELLAEVWEELGTDAPLLLVAGEVLFESEQPLVDRLALSPRAIVRAGYASDADLLLAVSACDALLLPYVRASESGILHLGRALGVPTITSDAPQLAAAVEATAAGISLPRRREDWCRAVVGPLPPPPPVPPRLEETGRAHVDAYVEAMRRRRRRT